MPLNPASNLTEHNLTLCLGKYYSPDPTSNIASHNLILNPGAIVDHLIFVHIFPLLCVNFGPFYTIVVAIIIMVIITNIFWKVEISLHKKEITS